MKIDPADNPAFRADAAGLTSAQFHILLTLAEGQRHGYGIMQEIERRTNGEVELGPGTLYRSLKQLLSRGFILEVEKESGGQSGATQQRRSYTVTPLGKARTAEEAQRVRALADWAEDALAPEGGRP
jgi:DNA-binding PadR family transcriptional regulator